jgi:phage-related holin
MKSILLASTATVGFFCSYFLQLTMDNAEQFLAVAAVLLLDGFFGIIAGCKREGFKTYKVIKSVSTWELILTAVLMIEKGFAGVNWISETIIAPFIIFQLISALKNASMAGLIKNELLNIILDKIDKHKGLRS